MLENIGFVRKDGRNPRQLREVCIEKNWSLNAEGSALISIGNTKVLCTASLTAGVPAWMKGTNKGWVTAEYSMLPRATSTRNSRESVKGKLSGRTQEISRLIGRSLRSVVNLKALGENTIVIDCDVLQADGGTRTASITGGYVALVEAVKFGIARGIISSSLDNVLSDSLAAISVGIYQGVPCLDLCYLEDSVAETDMNVVMTGKGEIIEVQGTAEKKPFSRGEMNELLDLACLGIQELVVLQRGE